MSQPPAGGYPPPPEQNPYGAPPAAGQPVPPPAAPPAGPPPAAAPPPGAYQPPPGPPVGAPAGPPPGYAPPPGAGYQPPAGGYPPPPPGAGYPQPGAPAPGYPGAPAPAGGAPSFNAANVATGDWIIIGTAVILLIFSFFGWLSASASLGLGYSYSYSFGAWHEYWWIATILGLAVGVVFALRAFAGQALQQIQPLFVLIAAGLGFVITLIALIELFVKGDSGAGYSVGPGIGVWICLIVSLIQTYLVWLWGQRQPSWTLPKLPGPVLWK